jgi:hypothetical protein
MSWTDDDELTEPSDEEFPPTIGVTCGERARPGDSYVLAFVDDGEKKEIQGEDRVEFAARMLDADGFNPVDTDREPVDMGEDIRLLTGSSPFLSKLAEYAPVGGEVLRVHIVGVGYDASYDVEPDEDVEA